DELDLAVVREDHHVIGALNLHITLPCVGVEGGPEIGDQDVFDLPGTIDRRGCERNVIAHMDREIGPLASEYQGAPNHGDRYGGGLIEVVVGRVTACDIGAATCLGQSAGAGNERQSPCSLKSRADRKG